MALGDLTDRSAVLAAMAEADRMGEAAFLAKYGFEPSRRYRVAHNGSSYSSKPILAAAHAVQFPAAGPLRNGDFSGGRETIEKVRALGFDIEDVRAEDDLGVALARFMALLHEARSLDFTHNHPAVEALRASAALIEDQLPPTLGGATVKPSVGRGNWAAVPWIAVLHPAVTTTTQQGVYPVLLFHENLRSVEVTVAQGVTDLKASLGRRAAVETLHQRAELLRPHFGDLRDRGFHANTAFDLGRSALGRDYVDSTIIHKAFTLDELPRSGVTDDLAALLVKYGDLRVDGLFEVDEEEAATSSAALGHQALMIYVGQVANANFETGGRRGWWGWREAPSRLETLRPGDLVVFGRGFEGGSPRVDQAAWRAHRLHDMVVGRITSTPERTDQRVMPDEMSGEASYPWKFRFDIVGDETDVPLAPGTALSEVASDELRRSAINRGAGYAVPVLGSPLLEAYVNESGPVEPEELTLAAESFVDAVTASGVRLPDSDVTAFFAALAAKPFAILTGQSGSGKTQLAKRLGEWFGSDAPVDRATSLCQCDQTGRDRNSSSDTRTRSGRAEVTKSGRSRMHWSSCCGQLRNHRSPFSWSLTR